MSKISLIFTLLLSLMWAVWSEQAVFGTNVPSSNMTTAVSIQWTTNNLRGGKANAIALSPDFANDGIVFSGEYLTDYQGTSSGLGIARSQDGGLTWQNSPISDEPYTSALYDVVVSGDGTVFAGTGGGLYRSNDDGTSWTRIYYSGPPGIVIKTAVSPNYPSTPHIMAAGGYGYLFVSHDDGATWQVGSTRYVNDLAYADAQTAFLAHFEGVDRTVDGGLTWTAVYTHPINAIATITQTIFAGGHEGDFHISYDSGTNWITHTIAADAGYVEAITPSPQFASDQTLFAGTTNGLYRSTDGGVTWQSEPSFVQERVLSLAWPSQQLLLVGTGDGVYRYDTASETSLLSDGFGSLTVTPLAQSGDGGLLLAGTRNHGIYRSDDGGASWQPAGLQGAMGYYSITALAITNDDTLFAARVSSMSIGASIYRSTNDGATWENVYNTDYVSHIAPSPDFASDGLVVATATSGGLMQSTDGGDSWALLSGWNGGWARVVMIDDNGRYLVGSTQGFWQSDDNGTTWQQATSGLTDGRHVAHIAIAPDGTLLASASWQDPMPDPLAHNTIFRSTDGGLNWQESADGWPNEWVGDIAFETVESAYAVTGTAVYHSTNGGQSWTAIGAPAESESLYRLLLRDGRPLVSGVAGVWQQVDWDGLLINGSFEGTDGWTLPFTPIQSAYSTAQAHGGTRSMRIGLTETMTQTYGFSSARQTVALPDNLFGATLRVWLYPFAGEGSLAAQSTVLNATTAGDVQYILLLDPADGTTILATLYWDLSNEQAWQELALPIPPDLAGREVLLHFGVKNDGENGRCGLYVDDASFDVVIHQLYLPLVVK